MVTLQYPFYFGPTTILQLSTIMGSLQTFMIYKCFHARPIGGRCVSLPRHLCLGTFGNGQPPTML
jgi:hypothetical protein